MGVVLGITLLLFGGGFFTRSVTSAREGAWAGPRSTGMRQRASSRGRSGAPQRSVRQELRLMREKAHLDDWGKQRDHERKTGTGHAATTAKTVTGTVLPPLQRARAAAQARFSPHPPAASNGNGSAPRAAKPPTPSPATAPSSPPNGSPGRTTTVAANGNAVEQLVEGVNQIHAQAQAGGLKAKQAGVKASHEGSVRFAQMAAMLSRAMSEPGMNYGPEITEPIAKAGTHLQAAAMSFSEADAALASLANMTVGDLAQSARQAPHHTELTESGNH